MGIFGTLKTGPGTPEAGYVVFKAMGKAGESPEPSMREWGCRKLLLLSLNISPTLGPNPGHTEPCPGPMLSLDPAPHWAWHHGYNNGETGASVGGVNGALFFHLHC